MGKETILIVEDDPDIVELLEYYLEREGYSVLIARDGEKGLAEAKRRKPSLVLLDLMLPGLDGLQVCRALKEDESTKGIPVMMLTARGEESDVVVGLEFGADDYVRKPFSPRELIARMRAVLRRSQPSVEARLRVEIGAVALDRERHEVTVDDLPVVFTRSEFRLLWRLAKTPGRVYSRDELVESLTDGEAVILDRNIDVHVSSIRKKLGAHGGTIVTVRGVGYKVLD